MHRRNKNYMNHDQQFQKRYANKLLEINATLCNGHVELNTVPGDDFNFSEK
jgi:hypothetical protein